jgi:hypothetical protein
MQGQSYDECVNIFLHIQACLQFILLFVHFWWGVEIGDLVP